MIINIYKKSTKQAAFLRCFSIQEKRLVD